MKRWRPDRFKLWIGLLVGILIGTLLRPDSALAQFINWSRDEVVPIVIVEPSLGSFIVKGGSVLNGQWSKSQVVPLVMVKPFLGGFVPADGSPATGNTWRKDDVRPYVIVKPGLVSGFVPAN